MSQAAPSQSIVPTDDSGNAIGPAQPREAGPRRTLADALDRAKSSMAAVATSFLTPDRLVKIVCTQLVRVPKLAECSIESVLSATMTCAELGLAPGVLGSAYLIPYGNQCQLIVGYRGMIELARRSGTITTIQAQVVREGDEWHFSYGVGGADFKHVPKAPTDAKIVGAWALATFKDGGHQFDYMSREEVDAIRKRSRAGNNGPWVSDFAEMAKKTVLRRLCKLLPLTPDVTEKIALADSTEFNMASIDLDPSAIRPANPAALAASASPDAKAADIAAKIDAKREAAKMAGEQTTPHAEPVTSPAPAPAGGPTPETASGAGSAQAKPTTDAEAAEFGALIPDQTPSRRKR